METKVCLIKIEFYFAKLLILQMNEFQQILERDRILQIFDK